MAAFAAQEKGQWVKRNQNGRDHPHVREQVIRQHGADKKVTQALRQLATYGVAFVACNHGIHRSPSVGETAAEERRAQLGPCEARLASSKSAKQPTICNVGACPEFSVGLSL